MLIAIGNSGEPALAEEAIRLLDDPSPVVRAMAVWAVGRLCPTDRTAALAASHELAETDDDVRREWKRALGRDPVAAPGFLETSL